MIQWILVILIIVAAFVYAGYRVYKLIYKPKKTIDTECDGCSSDCSSCPLFENSEIFKKP